MLLINNDLVVKMRRARIGWLWTHDLLAGGLVLSVQLLLNYVGCSASGQILRSNQRLLLLLITSVHDIVTIATAIHNASLINHHFALCARIRTQPRPTLVLRVRWIRTTRHVFVTLVLLIYFVQILNVIQHLWNQLLVLACWLLLPVKANTK